jgi:hypothetical protein
MGGACSAHGEMRNVFKILVGKPERNRPHARQRRRWENNIKINVTEIRMEVVDWSHLVQDVVQLCAFVIRMMDFLVP